MDSVAQRLLCPVECVGSFKPLRPGAQQGLLAERLRATRHLLILDSLSPAAKGQRRNTAGLSTIGFQQGA
jgi:hypothetical protein